MSFEVQPAAPVEEAGRRAAQQERRTAAQAFHRRRRDRRGEDGASPDWVFGADVSFDWALFSTTLPTGQDAASEAVRDKLWSVFDMNGNGLVSLAEWERGLHETFATKEAESIHRVIMRAKPAVARAFHAAKAYDQTKGVRQRASSSIYATRAGHDEDQFVSRTELRACLAHLRQVCHTICAYFSPSPTLLTRTRLLIPCS